MASTAARTAPVATAACAITSRVIASVPLASADAGMDGAETLGTLTAHLLCTKGSLCKLLQSCYFENNPDNCSVFFFFFKYINAKGRFTLAVKKNSLIDLFSLLTCMKTEKNCRNDFSLKTNSAYVYPLCRLNADFGGFNCCFLSSV